MANNMNNLPNNFMNPYNMNRRFNRDRLIRQRDEINYMLNDIDMGINMDQQTQQPPVNNIINTQQIPQNNNSTYIMKVLNDNDEVENIFIDENTIFIGNDKMQIKKLDGTIEKYEIKKYYPIDIKDKKIEELTNKLSDKDKQIESLIDKIKEIERRLDNNESSKSSESIKYSNGSAKYANDNTKSKSDASSKSV